MGTEKLAAFVNTLTGKDGTRRHPVTGPPGPGLTDALLSSPTLAGEGGDFEFGVDPSADSELALALRDSVEEQQAGRAAVASAAEAGIAKPGPEGERDSDAHQPAGVWPCGASGPKQQD